MASCVSVFIIPSALISLITLMQFKFNIIPILVVNNIYNYVTEISNKHCTYIDCLLRLARGSV